MTIIKKISNLLTPPIRRRSESGENTQQPACDIGGVARIPVIIKNIVCYDGGESKRVQSELNELRTIASRYGTYTIACEIQECTLRMTQKKGSGASFKKSRGFELAADLHGQDLTKTIDAFRQGKFDIEPLEFSRHVRNYLECMFEAKKQMKGIEFCVEICEGLVRLIGEPSNDIPLIASVAGQTSETILQTALKEKERADRKHNIAKRASQKHDTPTPETPSDEIDDNTLSRLYELRQKISHYVNELSGQNGHHHESINRAIRNGW